jgi:hypothetical protein
MEELMFLKNIQNSGVALAVLAFGLIAAAPLARAADLLDASLSACPADKSVIGGVNACGWGWKLGSGHATIGADGSVKVELQGLVLSDPKAGEFNGTPDGVDAVAVAVVCGAGAAAAVAGQVDPMPLSKAGDAKISAKLTLPASCAEPRVLVRERYKGNVGGWLAATGR